MGSGLPGETMAVLSMRLLELGPVAFVSVFLGLYALGMGLGIAVHELGHAGIAWLVGFPVRLIRIGHGPVLVNLPLGPARLTWCLWPVGGAVQASRSPARRLASLIYLLGGLAANLVVFALATAAWLLPREENLVALAIAAAQLPFVAGSALPYTRRWRGVEQTSDMLKVWRLLHRKTA